MRTMNQFSHISPLAISIGCGGFSIKGMFMSILGLDRIQEMLKSSATSFAYGIVVGLIYTMPGIFHAFQMLNQWAKKIQELMANACEAGKKIGKMIGKSFGMGEGFTGAVNKYLDKIPSPDGVIEGMDSAMGSFFKSLGLDYGDAANANTNKEEVVAPTDTHDTDPEEIEEMLAEVLQGVRVFNSMATSVMYAIMAGTNDNDKIDAFFCLYLDADSPQGCSGNISDLADSQATTGGQSLNAGSFFLTFADNAGGNNTVGLNEFLATRLGYDNDYILSKYMILLKAVIQKTAFGDMVVTDATDIKNALKILSLIVKARKNLQAGTNVSTKGFTDEAEKTRVTKELKEITKGSAMLLGVTPEAKFGKSLSSIGKGIARLMIGDNAVTGDFGRLKKIVPPYGFMFTVWPQDSTGHDSVGVSLFGLSSAKSMGDSRIKSFFQGITLPTKSLFKVSLEIASALVDRDPAQTDQQIIAAASAGLGNGNIVIPWIIPKFYIYAKVAQQSLVADREKAIKKLAQYNTCQVAMTALGVFQRTHMHGQGKMAFSFSFPEGGGSAVEMSKFTAAVKDGQVNSLNGYMNNNNVKKWDGFLRGFKSELLKIIQAESFADDVAGKKLSEICDSDPLEAFFQNLDVQNRKRAASQVDNASK